MRLLWAVVLTNAFSGCPPTTPGPVGDDTGDPDVIVDPDDPGTDPGGSFSVDVRWTGTSPSSMLEVVVHDPSGRATWNFGMAQTGAGGAGWYGEDCHLGTGATARCHDFSGTTLTLDQVSATSAVVEGATTLFWSGLDLTYYLDDGGSSCWVWGHDTSYYASLGCSDLGGGGATWTRRDRCSGMDPADPAPLHGKVALTFDDGPHATVTPQILATLRAHSVPATFLMVGRKADDPSLWNIADDIANDPLFDIGNHTWDHTDLALAAKSQVQWEVEDTTEAIEAFGVAPTFFRFPFGDSTCRTADIVREDHGYLIAGWHIDTADWCYASGGTCTRSEYWRIPSGFQSDMRGFILDQAEAFDGGVVLFHDTHQYTADHLEDVILDLLDAGYTFTRLDDANAFPRLNNDNPYDFPWVGESCDTAQDICWQVEYASWCEPTGAPGVPVTTGVCVLPCTGAQRCINRDGTAPLFCTDVGQGDDYCLARATPVNDDCADVPGTEKTVLWSPSGTTSAAVCLPHAW